MKSGMLSFGKFALCCAVRCRPCIYLIIRSLFHVPTYHPEVPSASVWPVFSSSAKSDGVASRCSQSTWQVEGGEEGSQTLVSSLRKASEMNFEDVLVYADHISPVRMKKGLSHCN